MSAQNLKNALKVPRQVKADIKDLVDPIVIRRRVLWRAAIAVAVLAAGVTVSWFTFFAPPSGEELLAQVVQVAGGMEAWNNIAEGSFMRTRTVFDENGKALRTEPAKFYFRKGAKGHGLVIDAVTEQGHVVIGNNGQNYWATKDGQPVAPKSIAQELGMMINARPLAPRRWPSIVSPSLSSSPIPASFQNISAPRCSMANPCSFWKSPSRRKSAMTAGSFLWTRKTSSFARSNIMTRATPATRLRKRFIGRITRPRTA